MLIESALGEYAIDEHNADAQIAAIGCELRRVPQHLFGIIGKHDGYFPVLKGDVEDVFRYCIHRCGYWLVVGMYGLAGGMPILSVGIIGAHRMCPS